MDRRRFLAATSTFGLGSTLFPGVLWAAASEQKKITRDMIDQAASVADVQIADEYKDLMLDALNDAAKDYDAIHELHLSNDVPPALVFDPLLPGIETHPPAAAKSVWSRPGPVTLPKNIEDVAFYTVPQLAELVRTRKVSSTALTQMYLERLKRYDPILHFVITLTEDRALAKAKEADKEIAAGKYRGLLHGLPWGAKDLLAVKGYRTTWGAGGFEQQKLDETATVVERLDRAGAVLVAKLTLGALAMGDLWFGGTTRNPWKLDQGSSGSSAGSASAVAAGCVAFAIGTETLGSIASPSTRCGVTGLRPTFGRVPRTGAMALSWSMDKIGPICRAVEDCAVVLDAIYGPDGKDPSVHKAPFVWNSATTLKSLRVGYLKKAFEHTPKQGEDDQQQGDDKSRKARQLEQKKFDDAALDVLRNKLGLKLIEVDWPEFPWGHMLPILSAEAAAAFDELTRTGRDKLLTAQSKDDWPNIFRAARFIPAVEYINANRARTLGMRKVAEVFRNVDVIVCPTSSTQLVTTNLTGHPAVILPDGFREDGTPVSITFLSGLYREDQALAVAKAYQDATDWHKKHPNLSDARPTEIKKG